MNEIFYKTTIIGQKNVRYEQAYAQPYIRYHKLIQEYEMSTSAKILQLCQRGIEL